MIRSPDPTTQKTSALLRRAASEFRSLASGPLHFDQEDRTDFMTMAAELTVRAHRIEAEWEGLGLGTFANARRDTLRFLDLPRGVRR